MALLLVVLDTAVVGRRSCWIFVAAYKEPREPTPALSNLPTLHAKRAGRWEISFA
jgi:hypothetical protein